MHEGINKIGKQRRNKYQEIKQESKAGGRKEKK